MEEVGLDVQYVEDLQRLPALLEDAAVLVIGGTGEDLDPIVTQFTPRIREALDEYLHDGGRYLGICGGAFLASTGWEEESGWVEMLDLVPAESDDLRMGIEPRIMPVRWLGETHPMYYQNGPTFYLVPSTESVRVIARYRDGQIAALLSSYGHGTVAVVGPHPEADATWAEGARNGEVWRSTRALLVDLVDSLLCDRRTKQARRRDRRPSVRHRHPSTEEIVTGGLHRHPCRRDRRALT